MAKIELTLSEESLERLNIMKAKIGCDDLVTVIKNAMQLYEASVDGCANGATLILYNPDGTTQVAMYPFKHEGVI